MRAQAPLADCGKHHERVASAAHQRPLQRILPLSLSYSRIFHARNLFQIRIRKLLWTV
jgi:hypothetical protein